MGHGAGNDKRAARGAGASASPGAALCSAAKGVAGKVMRRVAGLVLVSVSCLALPAHAARPAAPELATDAQGVTTLTGAHHLTGAAFSLIVTDWWLSAGIGQGQAQDVRLVVEVHMPSYPLLDRATDAGGRKLDLVVLNRGPSARWSGKASERVAVVLPRDYVEKARAGGLSITVSGKDRSFPIAVPGSALAGFLDSYAQAAASAGAPPVATAPAAPPALAPAPPPTQPTIRPPLAQPPAPPPVATPPASPAPPAGAAPDDDDPAITPIQDKRVRLPDGAFAAAPAPAPAAPPAAAPVDAPTPAPDDTAQGGHGTWVDSLGLQFVATSSGAMVLAIRPRSIAAAKGIESGDFIEKVDGVSIKTLDADHMAAKIGAPGTKVLHMIAAGDVKLR
jgi:hypothetical protein